MGISVATYDGHTGGLGIIPRNIGCSPLGFIASGAPNLGDSMTFSMSTHGTDLPVFAIGEPALANYTVCGSCAFGLNPSTVLLVPGDTLVITVPPALSLLGFNGGVQSMALGSGRAWHRCVSATAPSSPFADVRAGSGRPGARQRSGTGAGPARVHGPAGRQTLGPCDGFPRMDAPRAVPPRGTGRSAGGHQYRSEPSSSSMPMASP